MNITDRIYSAKTEFARSNHHWPNVIVLSRRDFDELRLTANFYRNAAYNPAECLFEGMAIAIYASQSNLPIAVAYIENTDR